MQLGIRNTILYFFIDTPDNIDFIKLSPLFCTLYFKHKLFALFTNNVEDEILRFGFRLWDSKSRVQDLDLENNLCVKYNEQNNGDNLMQSIF